MNCGNIFVVEDDPTIFSLIKDCLESAHFEVEWEQNGQVGLERALTTQADLLILDINLPSMDGLSICRELRKQNNVPVLMLSSHQDDIDKVIGLEVGADDYLGKPFNPRELVARARALIRRYQKLQHNPEPNRTLVCGKFSVDNIGHSALYEDKPIDLTPIEFKLLETLISNSGSVLSRSSLLEKVWGTGYASDERLVDVHIRNLRKKLAPLDDLNHVQSVRGIGYKWVG